MLTTFRIRVIGILAALLLAVPAGAALAQGAEPPAQAAAPGTHWRGGEVTAVGAGSFTTIGRRGETHEIAVTASTLFFDRDANPASLADLAVGDRVYGAVAVDEAGQMTAKLIVIIGPFAHLRAGGTVSALAAAGQSFTFTTRPGRVLEINVDGETIITNRAGDDLAFADLKVGDHLLLAAERRDDGQWWARRIGLRPADQTPSR
jgi:hypothetical protein